MKKKFNSEINFNNVQIREIDHSLAILLENIYLPSSDGVVRCIGDLIDCNFFIFHSSALPLNAPITLGMEKKHSIIRGVDILLEFNKLYDSLQDVNIGIYGISTQSFEIQKMMLNSLSLKFNLLSDKNAQIAKILNIPLTTGGRVLRYPLLVVASKENHATLKRLVIKKSS